MIEAKYMNPTSQGELSTISYWCWWFAHVFFDMKMMTLFSALFGAGMVLMWERAKAAGRKTTGLHYRRMLWLLVFGLAHAHLLWVGDILYTYAMCGMVMYWLSGLRARWLIPIGLLMLVVASAFSIMMGLTIPYWEETQIAEMQRGWTPTAEQINVDLDLHLGSWLHQQPHRSMMALMMQTFMFLFMFFWRAGGLMLIGMALFKMGVFSGKKSKRFYQVGTVVGLAVGLGLILTGVHLHEANEWSFEYSFFFGTQFNYWGSPFIAFAYVCIVMLLCQSNLLMWLQKSLAAVGQMALTNYLMHTIVCTTIFYGHGLGWYGSLDRIQLVGIVLAIWIIQLIASPIWLKHYRFGPFEWLWRSLAYWKRQPMKRSAPGS